MESYTTPLPILFDHSLKRARCVSQSLACMMSKTTSCLAQEYTSKYRRKMRFYQTNTLIGQLTGIFKAKKFKNPPSSISDPASLFFASYVCSASLVKVGVELMAVSHNFADRENQEENPLLETRSNEPWLLHCCTVILICSKNGKFSLRLDNDRSELFPQ